MIWASHPIEVTIDHWVMWPHATSFVQFIKENRDPLLVEWLVGRLGLEYNYWSNRHGRWRHTTPLGNTREVVVGFHEHDRDHALLFKLTWR